MKHEIDEDIVEAAIKTYHLEKMLDPDKDAVTAALAAGFIEIERRTTERIATAAEELAEHLRLEEDPSEEGAAALEIFAYEQREAIPNISRDYQPQDGDIVEVTLVGEVAVYEAECPECGANIEKTTWSVTDRATNSEYFFDPAETKGLRVRMVSPGVEDFI